MPDENQIHGATAQGDEYWDALLAERESNPEAFAENHPAHVVDSVERYARWKADVEASSEE